MAEPFLNPPEGETELRALTWRDSLTNLAFMLSGLNPNAPNPIQGMGMNLGPMAPAVLMGPATRTMETFAPRLSKFLAQHPNTVNATYGPETMWQDRILGVTGPTTQGQVGVTLAPEFKIAEGVVRDPQIARHMSDRVIDMVANLITQARLTVPHEGIHAAYLLKLPPEQLARIGQSLEGRVPVPENWLVGYPPRQYWPQLQRIANMEHVASQNAHDATLRLRYGPQAFPELRGLREGIVEGMAERSAIPMEQLLRYFQR